jgi:hypothetical protein
MIIFQTEATMNKTLLVTFGCSWMAGIGAAYEPDSKHPTKLGCGMIAEILEPHIKNLI